MKTSKDLRLCKLVKNDALKKALGAYKKLVEKPTHLCTQCGRVSNDKTRLCEPEKLD